MQIGTNTYVAFDVGVDFSAAITDNGRIWTWGYNISGQLGDGSTVQKLTPVQINGNNTYKGVSCGGDYTLATRTTGHLYGWGYNGFSNLGLPYPPSVYSTPQLIIAANNVTHISGSYNASLVICGGHVLYAWGTSNHNNPGQLLTPGNVTYTVPTHLKNLISIILMEETYNDNEIPVVKLPPPKDAELKGNYPNPFNPSTTISFFIKESLNVSLNVYNLKGQLVSKLLEEEMPSGSHHINWNGTDDNHQPVSSGVYLYRLHAGDYLETKKMMLLK